MKKQYAVLGLGSFGFSVAKTLEDLGCEVVAVDQSEEKVQEAADSISYVMRANVQDPELLKSLGARNLDGAIIAIAEDLKASILATILSKEMGIPFVLAKAKNDLEATILRKVGADEIVLPEREMGVRVGKRLVSKNFADWIGLSSEYSMVERKVPKTWVGKSLEELRVRVRFGVNVVGVVENEEVRVQIDPEEPLKEDLTLILIGSNKELQAFYEE